MIVIFGVFAAIVLLLLIVYVLHKLQQKEKEKSVDRSSPLPPLSLHQIVEDNWQDQLTVQEDHDWQVVARQLKDDGQFRRALGVCRSAYPQMGAFKQSCILLRAEIRELKRRGKDVEECLAELYKVCAMAALFHEKNSDTPVLSASALKKVPYAEFEKLSMPYKELGFAHLKLLTATDLKMMGNIWGAPNRHRHVRDFHMGAWQQILVSSGTR